MLPVPHTSGSRPLGPCFPHESASVSNCRVLLTCGLSYVFRATSVSFFGCMSSSISEARRFAHSDWRRPSGSRKR